MLDINRIRRVLVVMCSLALLTGCYKLLSRTFVLNESIAWTGTGRASGSGYMYAFGLAGRDVYEFRDNGSNRRSQPLAPHFSGAHTLTSIAQTHNNGHYEHTFLHAYPAGNPGALDLFYTSRLNLEQAQKVPPLDPVFLDRGVVYTINRICDMAAADTVEYGFPTDSNSHLFLSVIACENGRYCAGGIVEVQFQPRVMHWTVKAVGGGAQATIRRSNGARFPNECLPISATGPGGASVQYVAVGAPSASEISLFRVGQLHAGPVSTFKGDVRFTIDDVTIDGARIGTTDYAIVTGLWKGSSGTKVEHYLVTRGRFGRSPFLTEALDANVRYIQTRRQDDAQLGQQNEELLTFGSVVTKREYEPLRL